MSDREIVPFDTPASGEPRPPEFERAPAWAQLLWDQQRRNREHTDHKLEVLTRTIDGVKNTLGEEPMSDGAGGKGLVGDLRKVTREVEALTGLKKMGLGAVGAITVFGALILLGVIHWIQSLPAAAGK